MGVTVAQTALVFNDLDSFVSVSLFDLWLCLVTCGILVPHPGTKPLPLQWKTPPFDGRSYQITLHRWKREGVCGQSGFPP